MGAFTTMKKNSFIEHLKKKNQAIWNALVHSADKGMLTIDEETGSISSTNRLLLTNAILQENLKLIANDWAENTDNTDEVFRSLLKGDFSDDTQ